MGLGAGYDALSGNGAFEHKNHDVVDENGPWAFPGAIPDYQSTNPSQGLYSKNQAGFDAIQPNKEGINKFRSEALRTGPSNWASLANGEQDRQAGQATSKAASSALGQTAQARNALSMRGGIDSGARERLETAGGRNYLDMASKINDSSASNHSQIAINDEQNRISQLGSLPGLENQALQPDFEKLKMKGQADQFDLQNWMQNQKGQNDYNLKKYDTQMQGWAAGKQANATANSGKK